MEHMRMIIQIQAQIDSCLVDGGEEGLLATNLGGGAGGATGEPNSRLVRQAIKLLRMRHRVLQVKTTRSIPGIQSGMNQLFVYESDHTYVCMQASCVWSMLRTREQQ